MRIIIAGAGDVGFHLAKLLSYENHDIVVIDLNDEKLKHLSSNLDVATIKGSSTSYAALEEADVNKADLFISVTSFDDPNITSAIFAKHLGAKMTNTQFKLNIMALEFNDKNFGEVLSSDKLTVIDFWAPWCGPCKMVGPIIEGLADEYGDEVNIGKMDVDNNPNTSFKYKVRSIPTVLVLKNGEVVEKKVGGTTKAAYEKMLNSAVNA